MKSRVDSVPGAISNLQKYYEDCQGYLENSGNKSLAAEILDSIIEDEIKEDDVFFSIVYEKDNNLICMQGMNSGFSESIIPKKNFGTEDAIQNFFDEEADKRQKQAGCKYFRYAGVWVNEDNVIKGKIYYVFRIYGWDHIQVIYLNALEEAYYEWIRKEIMRIANPFMEYKEFGNEYRIIKDWIIKRTEVIFEEKMLNLYGIDLGIVTEISGNYYEGEKCNSALVLKIGNRKDNGVFFAKSDYVEIKRENAKRLRKILEMCQAGKCILAERGANLKWMVKGICHNGSDAYDILFKIRDHMFWEMWIGEKFLVCYKYGKYVIGEPTKKREKFDTNYLNVFGKETDEYLKAVFIEAEKQPHGTSIIILGNGNNGKTVQDEVDRLLKDSSGIAIEDKIKIPIEFIIGVTSIDGAVIMDKSGNCHAIGVILDGNVAIKGDRTHGARHNSVMKYIKTKRDEGLKGIGIIFSEDKTIKFISTEDDFGGHEDERR